jgi:hypothetical protein
LRHITLLGPIPFINPHYHCILPSLPNTISTLSMQYTLASLALAASASAAILPRNTCTFSLTASGGESGTVGQLDDGQNRVGGGLPTGSYSINNGMITDSQGRGCILTPPTTQFQCDAGATPTSEFSLGSNGEVTYNGSQTFYACPAEDNEYNIYTSPVSDQDKCVKIQLTASDCYEQQSPTPSKPQQNQPAKTVTVTKTEQSQCPAPKTIIKTEQSPAQTVTKTEKHPPETVTKTEQSQCPAPQTIVKSVQYPPAPMQSNSGKHCPADLSGAYQYPHLIIPVSSSSPNKAYGTSYNGEISSTVSSIFNFDIPTSYTGTCSLVFLFPEQSQLQTSSFTFSGNGEIDFAELSTVATQATTYASQGHVKTDYGVKTVTPGSSTVVATFPCPAGQAVSYELGAKSGTSLTYFQDYNPSPIGLYITSC